ncbi:MAG TPA: hypothetical protein VET88_07685 [Gammaproteobacteria bacterium]|nr:hypothetical protein [Gammaproteobacteria bacterium]
MAYPARQGGGIMNRLLKTGITIPGTAGASVIACLLTPIPIILAHFLQGSQRYAGHALGDRPHRSGHRTRNPDQTGDTGSQR